MIIKYLIKKYLIAISITIPIILLVFFVFSLIGNLDDSYEFKNILIFSILSTIQIISYIPLIIFFLITLTFFINLKTRNELIIILHYVSIKKITVLFLFIILFFSFLELKNDSLIKHIELVKYRIIDETTNHESNIIVNYENTEREYILIKKKNDEVESLNLFNIKNNKVNHSIFSKSLILDKSSIITNDYYELKENKINHKLEKKVLFSNFDKSILSNKINYFSNSRNFSFNTNLFLRYIILFSSFYLILIMFLEKKYIFSSSYAVNFYLSSQILVLYTYTMINYDLNYYQIEFKILSILLLLSVMIKKIKYD